MLSYVCFSLFWLSIHWPTLCNLIIRIARILLKCQLILESLQKCLYCWNTALQSKKRSVSEGSETQISTFFYFIRVSPTTKGWKNSWIIRDGSSEDFFIEGQKTGPYGVNCRYGATFWWSFPCSGYWRTRCPGTATPSWLPTSPRLTGRIYLRSGCRNRMRVFG